MIILEVNVQICSKFMRMTEYIKMMDACGGVQGVE